MSYYDGLPDVLPGFQPPNLEGANAALGTSVRMPDGTYRTFPAGTTPKIFIGDEFPGGWAAAVPGTEEYDHYSSVQQRSNTQGYLKVGALVGGAALAGGLLGGAGAAGASTAPYIAPGASITGAPLAAGGGASLGAGAAVGGAGAAAGGGGVASWLNWVNLADSVLGAYGAHKASDAQAKGAEQATAEAARQFDTARSDLLPTINLGKDAATQLQAVNNGDRTGFYTSPGYQFNLAQGQQNIDRKLTSLGLNGSGAAVKEGARFASGLASNEYNDYYQHLLASAGLGTSGSTTSAAAGSREAAQVGDASLAAGNARASGYANMYGALQGGISNELLRRYMGKP